MKLYVTSLIFVIGISCVVAYSSVLPVFKPVADFIGNARAISLIGLIIIFTILTPNGFWLKVAILTFATTPWFITSMLGIISEIPHGNYEYARTLKCSEWKVTWRVVIRGTLHQVIESFRQIAIMCVVMLPVAERLSRSDGGIGAILASLERFQRLDKIYALDIMIIVMVIGQDHLLKYIRNKVCPYSKLMEGGK